LLGAALGFVAVGIGYAVLRFALMGTALQGNLERAKGVKLAGATAAQVARTFLPGLPFGDSSLNNAQAIRSLPGLGYLVLGVMLAIAVVLIARRNRQAPVGLLVAAFGISLLPALGLSVRLFRSQGERFVYFPSAFAIMLLALALHTMFESRRVYGAVAAGLCLLGTGLVQWQNTYWRQGAALSRRVQASFVRDVVRQSSGKDIALLNVPASVQGAYGVAYVFESVAPLFEPGRKPKVSVLSVMRLADLDHSVVTLRNGSAVELTSFPALAIFSQEDTFTGRSVSAEELSRLGYREFGPRRMAYDLSAIPPGRKTFYWDGARFWPIETLVNRAVISP
jgi:hypothetical protein